MHELVLKCHVQLQSRVKLTYGILLNSEILVTSEYFGMLVINFNFNAKDFIFHLLLDKHFPNGK